MAQDPGSNQQANPAPVRFEATVRYRTRAKALEAIAELDLDRLPDVNGKLRFLISADDARRLLERGFEVHLLAALPVTPLPKALIMSDQHARAWLDEQLKGITKPKKG